MARRRTGAGYSRCTAPSARSLAALQAYGRALKCCKPGEDDALQPKVGRGAQHPPAAGRRCCPGCVSLEPRPLPARKFDIAPRFLTIALPMPTLLRLLRTPTSRGLLPLLHHTPLGLVPQICVNLGITQEAEGLLMSACDHYRPARGWAWRAVRAAACLLYSLPPVSWSPPSWCVAPRFPHTCSKRSPSRACPMRRPPHALQAGGGAQARPLPRLQAHGLRAVRAGRL